MAALDRKMLLALSIAAVVLGACNRLKPSHGNKRSGGANAVSLENPATPASVSPFYAGGKNLKVKRADLLAKVLEAALGLSGADLCTEADGLSCLDDVHKIALGGISPYDRGVFRGWDESPSTAPLALERVVSAGCSKRVELDIASPADALLWKGNVDAEYVTQNYQRFLGRDPTADEKAAALAIAPSLGASEWAWAVCFATATHVEALFY